MRTQIRLRQYQEVVFQDDEQKVTIGAERLQAVDGNPGMCLGCHMKNGWSCDIWRDDVKGSRCQPTERKDGRSVVWVPEASQGA